MQISGRSLTWLLAVLVVACSPPKKASQTAAGSASVQVTCTQGTGPFSGGTGTTDDPYVICSESDLEALDTALSGSDYDSFKDKHYIQARDIDLGGVTKSYLPLGLVDGSLQDRNELGSVISDRPSSKPFLGTYDGNLKRILNMTFQSTEALDFIGFFAMIGATGVVKRMIFESPTFDLEDSCFIGTVAAATSGRIEDITVRDLNASLVKARGFGGIAGAALGALRLVRLSIGGSVRGTKHYTLNENGEGIPENGGISAVAPVMLALTPEMLDNDPSKGITTLIEDVTSTLEIDVMGDASGISVYTFGPVILNRVANEGAITSQHEAAGISLIAAKLDTAFGQTMVYSGPVARSVTNSGAITVTGTLPADRTLASGLFTEILNLSLEDSGNSGRVSHTHKFEGAAAGIGSNIYELTARRIWNSGDISYLGEKLDLNEAPVTNGDVGGLFATINGIPDELGPKRISIEDCSVTGSIHSDPDHNDIGGIFADIWDLPDPMSLSVENCIVSATLTGGNGGESGRGVLFGQVNIGAAGPSGETPSVTFKNLYWNTTLAPSRNAYVDAGGFVDLMGGPTFADGLFTPLDENGMHQPSSFGFDFDTIWNAPTSSTHPTLK